jgi:hypothetical protein
MEREMVYPELRSIHSPTLEPPALPDDPIECEVVFEASIGPKDGEGEELFAFSVVTPAFLARSAAARWGRGSLIVPTFEWGAVVHAVAELLARCARETWGEVAAELDRELVWRTGGDGSADA